MIRIQNFNFIIWKFLQMSKLLYNILKISGGANAPNDLPWLRAWFWRNWPCIGYGRCVDAALQLMVGGRKTEVKKTVNKIFYFYQAKFLTSGAHGTYHAFHTIDT